ncbi:DUF2812 domain-containing protein [Domibacillus robiginosus]|uniref:DUF2812 domain-containing protein n=1 Tax=Domibacillus robiginosus TaxID=1071054 RepID=UPI00067CE7F1|nr:DUF2812 domain-containing protein [Domibacillus robiginosus]
MKKTKYMGSGGLAFDEEQDMTRLEKMARKGWMFDRFAFMGYKLKKAQPQEIQYSLDYRKNADSDYFAYFKEAGWSHVASSANYIHLFSAPPGTVPIYSDKETMIDKYENEKIMMRKGAFVMLLVTLLCMAAIYFTNNTTLFSGIQGLVEGALNIVLCISLIGLIFTGMPYVGYLYRVNKLKKIK